jgi:hypothetical protein
VGTLTAIYQNYADTAVVGGGSYVLPLSNLRDPDIGKVARSTNPLAASTVVRIDLGAARAIGGVALGPTNLSPGAQYRVRAYSDAALTTLISSSGLQTISGSRMDWADTAHWLSWEDPGFWFGIPDLFGQPPFPPWAFAIFATDVTARYWLVEVFDEGNRDGFVQYGRLVIGRAFRPSVNYVPGAEFRIDPIFLRSESIGGRRDDWDIGRRRALRVSFPELLAEAELFGDILSMQHVLGASKQMFVAPDPDDTGNFQKRSFLATLKSPPPIVQAGMALGSTAFDLEEVL